MNFKKNHDFFFLFVERFRSLGDSYHIIVTFFHQHFINTEKYCRSHFLT